MTPPYKTFVDVVSTTSGSREFKNPKSISSGVRIAIFDDAIGTFDGTKGDDDDVIRSHRDDEDKGEDDEDRGEDDEDDDDEHKRRRLTLLPFKGREYLQEDEDEEGKRTAKLNMIQLPEINMIGVGRTKGGEIIHKD